MLRSFPAVVEVWGWDEAFVGARPTTPRRSPPTSRRACRRTGLTCAVGIGDTRLQAKTATGFAKPGGIARAHPPHWIATMGARPVTAIWGIGSRTAARLAELGITTVAELAARRSRRAGPAVRADDRAPPQAPRPRRRRLARSSTNRGSPGRAAKEETFKNDVADPGRIAGHVDRLATSDRVGGRRGPAVTHVAVKVRTATFFTRTKISKLAGPTTDAEVVARWPPSSSSASAERPLRLLGVRVVLAPPGPTG